MTVGLFHVFERAMCRGLDDLLPSCRAVTVGGVVLVRDGCRLACEHSDA